jgi:hypothetical protein
MVLHLDFVPCRVFAPLPRWGSPTQGVALGWANGWAFGPSDTKAVEQNRHGNSLAFLSSGIKGIRGIIDKCTHVTYDRLGWKTTFTN